MKRLGFIIAFFFVVSPAFGSACMTKSQCIASDAGYCRYYRSAAGRCWHPQARTVRHTIPSRRTTERKVMLRSRSEQTAKTNSERTTKIRDTRPLPLPSEAGAIPMPRPDPRYGVWPELEPATFSERFEGDRL